MNITQLMEQYTQKTHELLTQYDEGLISAKEYLHLMISTSLDYLHVAESLKDTYEK